MFKYQSFFSVIRLSDFMAISSSTILLDIFWLYHRIPKSASGTTLA